MRNKKGAIAFYTLIAMMFFLIFIMAAYSNVSTKNKMQSSMDLVVSKTYNPTINASTYLSSTLDGDISKSNSSTYVSKLKSTKEREAIENITIESNVTKYICLNGKLYKITN